MERKPRIAFFLPARKGSQRVKNKNTRTFAGIEGELIRIAGHRRVVVRLENLFSIATVFIPSGYLEKIETQL